MNTITLYVDEYSGSNCIVKDGITFKNVQIIKLLIDGEDIDCDENLSGSLIYMHELSKSYIKSGKYLIFTCANGIAIDGGWEGIDVTVDADMIKWKFEVGNIFYHYTFEKDEYVSEVKSIENFLKVHNQLTLEPSVVMYPEDWNKA